MTRAPRIAWRLCKSNFSHWLVLLIIGVRALEASGACNIAPEGSDEEFVEPGLFQARPAPTYHDEQRPCGNPFEIPQISQVPFWLGVATSAYQIEGAAKQDGRGPSIWDTFSETPGKTTNGDTGDVAVDFYNKYLEDIALMSSLGIRNFRLSLSWSRLIPDGIGQVNQAGVDFYNSVIDALLANCIQPYITLFHWDLPQNLQAAYGGWLGEQVVKDFGLYAETAFALFGDRVKYWSTINEPLTICNNGYKWGVFPPGRCSNRSKCEEGDSVREPELCAYHALLAHSEAVPVFRRLVPDGKISINTNLAPFYVPLTGSKKDKDATEKLNRYTSGQFLDPLFTGDWTLERLAALTPEELPRFTPEQSQALQAAKPDYLALQFYNGAFGYFNSSTGSDASTTTGADGTPLPTADSSWLHVFPESFRAMLGWVKQRYGDTPIIITENGVDVPGEDAKSSDDALCDTFRVDFFRQYLDNARKAKEQDGVNMQGYFAWSLLDNFEWADGFSKRFGIIRVDYNTLQRHYKASALWLANLFGLSKARSAVMASQRASGNSDGSAVAG